MERTLVEGASSSSSDKSMGGTCWAVFDIIESLFQRDLEKEGWMSVIFEEAFWIVDFRGVSLDIEDLLAQFEFTSAG